MSRQLLITASFLAQCVATGSGALAQDGGTPNAQEDGIEEIVVTARLRSETKQDVPDAITVLSSRTIDAANIDEINDVFLHTPGVVIRETFRQGVTFITARGIGTAQQGWAPVTLVVDGVKAQSLDAFNQGALFDIERIEFLKGPQSPLYGANAIAGAINIVTKEPTDEYHGRVKASVARGQDFKLMGSVSGPIVEDRLFFRASAYYRNTDGLIDRSGNTTHPAMDLDFEEQISGRTRFVYNATENVSVEFRLSYSNIDAGAIFQEKLPIDRADLIDEFRTDSAPGPARFPDLRGFEQREFIDLSGKLEWDFSFANLRVISGYQDLEQNLFGSVSFTEPPSQASLFGPVFGENAVPGEAIDDFQDLADNFRAWTFDARLTSSTGGPLQWVFGVETLERTAVTQLGIGRLVAPMPGTLLPILNRFDLKKDNFVGIYGQLAYEFRTGMLEGLELSFSGRWDENDFSSGQVAPPDGDGSVGPGAPPSVPRTPIPTVDPEGNIVDRQVRENNNFQPKAQVKYNFTDDIMGFFTFSQGFRSGFFSTGNFTAPETMENFEIGGKSQFFDGRLTLNASAFHMDFSGQQISEVISEFPFRIVKNVPSVDINGVEVEIVAVPSSRLRFTGGMSYLKSDINGEDTFGTQAAPRWTANLGIEVREPLGDNIEFIARADYRYQGRMFLNLAGDATSGFEDRFFIKDKNFLNLRTGLEWGGIQLMGFFENILNTRQATDFGPLSGGLIRNMNRPWSGGAEIRYDF